MSKKPAGLHEMKIGTVIGRVTLSQTVHSLIGARWLIVTPFTREQYLEGNRPMQTLSKEWNLIVYDDLGGAVGQNIGYVEGREAAQPFDQPTPIDAINVALVDGISYFPLT
jgi:microcompartment protein CcmK/EutM